MYMLRVYTTGREDDGGDVGAGLQLEELLHRSFGLFSPTEHRQRSGLQHIGNTEARIRLARQPCSSGRFFKTAGGEMCVGQAG